MTGGPLLRSTRITDLIAPFVLVGVAVYVVLRFEYESLPPLKYLTAVPLVALGLVEMVAARRARAAVRHEPHARPMAAIVIARLVALGKASSLVGAGVMGGCVAVLVYVLPDAGMVRAAAADARAGVVVLAAAMFLTATGLLLERAGLDPNRDRREH